MASNIFASNADTPTGAITFDKPVDHINLYVAAGVTFSISFDKGANYLTVLPGFYSMRIGQTKSINITATGVWQLIAVQA